MALDQTQRESGVTEGNDLHCRDDLFDGPLANGGWSKMARFGHDRLKLPAPLVVGTDMCPHGRLALCRVQRVPQAHRGRRFGTQDETLQARADVVTPTPTSSPCAHLPPRSNSGTMNAQAGPVARLSLKSSVASAQSKASATATYHASWHVTFRRSSHTRSAKGAKGNNSTSSRSRSRWAPLASILEICPRLSRRRSMFAASTWTSSGAASVFAPTTDSPHRPSGPESTNVATTTDASTTTVTCGQRRARTGCYTPAPAYLRSPSVPARHRATDRETAAKQSAPVHAGDIPALTGATGPHGLRVRRGLRRERP